MFFRALEGVLMDALRIWVGSVAALNSFCCRLTVSLFVIDDV